MDEIHKVCFDIINLLASNIQPKVEFDPNFINTECDNKNELGLIYVTRFFEKVSKGNNYIELPTDELYYKLNDLSHKIILMDSGETSAFQNYLYDKINEMRDLVNPNVNPEKRIQLKKLINNSLFTDVPHTSASLLHNFDAAMVSVCDLKEKSVAYLKDPVYQKISEVCDSLTTESDLEDSSLSNKIDCIVDSLDLKSPDLVKNALFNKLKEINDVVNLSSKSDKVIFTNYIKLQADEIYFLLKNDEFYEKADICIAESKNLLLNTLRNVKNFLNTNTNKMLARIKQIPSQIYNLLHGLILAVISNLSTQCKQLCQYVCILISIFNIIVIGLIVI